ncbi:MAG: hypothetical protein AABX23_03895 [Nanoarchaeota archaeon]
MNKEKDLHLAIIAGATSALEHLKQNRNATHDDALRHVIDNADGIINNIDFSQ